MSILYMQDESFNLLRPRQNGRHFADDIYKRIFLNENVRISIKISLKFVPKGPIDNIPALDQIMAWRRPGDKPLSEPMMVSLPTHICVTRPQWVNLAVSKFTIPWPGRDWISADSPVTRDARIHCKLGRPAHAYTHNHDRSCALSQLTIFGSKNIHILWWMWLLIHAEIKVDPC